MTSSPYNGKDSFVFVSYAHRDSDVVFEMIARMQRDGYRVWFDEGITPGKDWDCILADRIEQCSLFLAFLSENYLGSGNCTDELFFARDMEKPLLLAFLDSSTLSGGMRMRLGRTQAIFRSNYGDLDGFLEKLYQTEEIQACSLRGEADDFGERDAADIEEEYRKAVRLLDGGTAGADAFQAAACLKRAAAQGHAGALALLGGCYQKGTGVERDMEKAVGCYEESAAAGCTAAMNSLALCCLWGLGRKQDRARAVELYLQAAQAGDAAAQNNLGHCYESGTGVEADAAIAAEWYEKAAAQGYAEAQNSLGLCYENGTGVPKNPEKAVEYYSMAAAAGHTGEKKNPEYLKGREIDAV